MRKMSKVDMDEPKKPEVLQLNQQKEEDVATLKEKTIEDLPPEMLFEILKHVDSPRLFQHRFVSRKWNKVIISLLQLRADTTLKFTNVDWGALDQSPSKNKFTWERSDFDREKMLLADLIKCFNSNSNSKFFPFPFVRFEIHQLHRRTNDLESFIKKCGSLIQFLEVQRPKSEEELETFQELLTSCASNLTELTIDGQDCIHKPTEAGFESFSLYKKSTKQSELIFPNLKIFTVAADTSEYYQIQVVKDIIQAAPHLKRIDIRFNELRQRNSIEVEDLQFFNSLGKVHLITKSFALCLNNPEMDNYWKENPGQMLKVKQLTLCTGTSDENEETEDMRKASENMGFSSKSKKSKTKEGESEYQILSRVSSFLNRVMEHTEETLREVDMSPLGFLSGVDWNRFKNVQKLTISAWKNPTKSIFTSGIRKLNIFPHLVELTIQGSKFGDSNLFPSVDFIPLLPTVRALRIKAEYHLANLGLTSDFIKTLALMCPNLSSLTFDPVKNFPEFGSSIWTNMENLTHLDIGMQVKINSRSEYGAKIKKIFNVFPSVDATFTGYSESTCQKLFKEYGKRTKIDDSIVQQNPRTSPSILDLKHLRRLIVRMVIAVSLDEFSGYDKENEIEKQTAFKTVVGPVSRLFAFGQMPQLEFTLEKDLRTICDCGDCMYLKIW